MNYKQIRKGMETLWKETFGDSDAYIRLIFDTYFNPETIAYHADGEQVVSSLLGVPYEFYGPVGLPSLKGLYLCGLSTALATRRKGMMTRLLEQINAKARAAGFDFTFLIPSSEENGYYYAQRGFHKAFYKVRQHYVKDHVFKTGEGLENAVFRHYDGVDPESLLTFLTEFETTDINLETSENREVLPYSLKHSPTDWSAVVREAMISEEDIYVARAGDKLMGVAFTSDKGRELEVRRIITAEKKYYDFLLKGIIAVMKQDILIVLEDVCHCEDMAQVWRPFYAQNNPKDAEYEEVAEVRAPFSMSSLAEPYGMVKILDIRNLLAKLKGSNVEDCKAYEGFSDDDLIKLVLRQPLPGGRDPIGELLDIRELDLNMSLMLE